MKVHVKIEAAPKALRKINGSAYYLLVPAEQRQLPLPAKDLLHKDAPTRVQNIRSLCQDNAKLEGNGEDPLSKPNVWQDIVHKPRSCVAHAPAIATRAKATLLARKCKRAAHGHSSYTPSGRIHERGCRTSDRRHIQRERKAAMAFRRLAESAQGRHRGGRAQFRRAPSAPGGVACSRRKARRARVPVVKDVCQSPCRVVYADSCRESWRASWRSWRQLERLCRS
jgi:hypothetical protein